MKVRFSIAAIPIVAFCLPGLLLAPCPSDAAEWWAEPSVRLGLEYNDNIRWTTQPHNTVHGSVLSPKLDLGARSEIWQVSGSAELARKRYSGEDGLDRDDRLFKLASQYKTERNTWQLDGSLTRDSVITGQEIDPDVGSTQIQRERETRAISPTWTGMMTERTQLQLAYQLSNVSYENGVSLGLYDYRSRTTTARLANQISLRDQVFVIVGYSDFDVSITSFESKTTNVQAGITHIFSESLRATLVAGGRRTSSEGIVSTCTQKVLLLFFGRPVEFCVQTANITVSQVESGSLLNANLEKQFEVARLSATLGRALNSSGSGTQVETDTMKLRIERPVTPMLTGVLTVNAYDLRSETGSASGNDRKSYQIEPELRWQLTREWSMGALYRYAHLKRANEAEAVTVNFVNLMLAYRWPKASISR